MNQCRNEGSALPLFLKFITMPNKLKTPQEKHLELLAARQKKYAQESLGMGWFFAIIAGALLLTALIENL